MKRDFEVIRKILLECERHSEAVTWVSDVDADEDGVYYGFSDPIEKEHFRLLIEASLIEDVFESANNERPARFGYRLTWAGHDFVDAIRDQNIWQKTKAILLELGGSSALEIVKHLALEVAKQSIKAMVERVP